MSAIRRDRAAGLATILRGMRGPLRGARAAVAVLAMLAGLAPGVRAVAAGLDGAVPMRASVSPSDPPPQLGEALQYRGWVIVDHAVMVRWQAPDRSGDLVWGPVRTGRVPLTVPPGGDVPFPADSVWVTASLQVFATGDIAVPGLPFALELGGRVRQGTLPVVNLKVVSVLPPANANASDPRAANPSLRPPRGPIGAPWWEAVPWAWVIGGLLLAALVTWLVFRMRRKKPVTPVAVPSAPAKRRDPAAEALAELAALRRRELPASGRFAEHAFFLGRILRRYLEATTHVPRPGDTTPELIRHLRGGGFEAADVERLTGLLRRWDAIKFARLDSDVSEAERCEEAVRELVVRRNRAPKQEVA